MLVAIILLLFMMCAAFKNVQTFLTHRKILDAIYLYRCHCIRKDVEPMVRFEDMESYDSTLFRFWDWGYKRILPPEKYEIIKPFINIKKEN